MEGIIYLFSLYNLISILNSIIRSVNITLSAKATDTHELLTVIFQTDLRQFKSYLQLSKM